MAKIKKGQIVKGKVTGVKGFGAFVKIKNTKKTGLVHISEIANTYVQNVEDYLSEGDRIRVKIKNIKNDGKIDLSWKQVSKEQRWVEVKNNSRFLPQDTLKAVGTEKIENLHLLANRFLNEFEDRSKFDNKEIIRNIKSAAQGILDKSLIEEIKNRNEAQLQGLKKAGYETTSFNLINDYRLVVGLGGANVLETNLLMHHIYGLPYIPGSILKGAAKSWAVEDLSKKSGIEDYEQLTKLLETDELKGKEFPSVIENELQEYRTIFGTQQQSGEVCFFNSFPQQKPKFKVDIMNQHFKDYYGEMGSDNPNKWPKDSTQPNPIPFLVLEGTTFKFRLAARNDKNRQLIATAHSLLENALRKLGVGAKTAIGYGYFK